MIPTSAFAVPVDVSRSVFLPSSTVGTTLRYPSSRLLLPSTSQRRLLPTARFNFNISGGHDRYADWAAELFGQGDVPQERPSQERPSKKPESAATEDVEAPPPFVQTPPTHEAANGPEFRTAWDGDYWMNKEDVTAREFTVTRREYLNGARDIAEVEVDVSGTTWDGAHTKPGMFCQLAVGDKRGLFTIASRPEKPGVLSFLVGVRQDPVGVAKVRVGRKIRMSPVVGEGFEAHSLAAKDMKNLYLLVDCVQGYAAVRSLLDWEAFRAASGEGMNRTTRATVVYGLPSIASLPDAKRFGEWAMWGINVVPVVDQSLVQYLQSGGLWNAIGGGSRDQSAGAVACVAGLHEAEALFSELSGKGVRRERFSMYTEHRVMKEAEVFESDENPMVGAHARGSGSVSSRTADSGSPRQPAGMPDDVFEYMYRQYVEDQIWSAWVGIREPMREEFERKWTYSRPGSRSEREQAAAAAEKKQAWESWFMRNKDSWNTNSMWEDVSWGSYWAGWESEHAKWGTEWGEKTAKNPWAAGGSAWSQQSSQEFWDQAYGNNGGSGGRSYDSYSDRYSGSSGAWGKSSTHADTGGYRYTYEEPSGGKSSSSSSSRGYQHAWNNSSHSSRNYTSGSGSRSGGTAGFGSTKLDFYAVLGVGSGATGAEIKKAYRKAALANHPDLNPGPGSTERMQEVVVAYMTLKDMSKRQKYDRYGI